MNPAMLKKMKMPAAKTPSTAQAAKRSPMGEEEDLLAMDIEGEPDGDEAAPSPLADISDDELLMEMKKRGLGGGKPAVSPEEEEEDEELV